MPSAANPAWLLEIVQQLAGRERPVDGATPARAANRHPYELERQRHLLSGLRKPAVGRDRLQLRRGGQPAHRRPHVQLQHFHTDTISTGAGDVALQFLGADQNQLWDVDGSRYQENLLGLSHQSTGETYVRDPDTGAVHSMTKSGDKRFFLHDEKNSTLGLLSPDEAIERAYSYDPDGNATVSGTGPDPVVQWVGGVNLDNQGIYHFGARLYNPAIGRWTQPDPINQYSDLRQANLYLYAGGDPINNVDSTGMAFCVSRWFCVGLSEARRRAERTGERAANVVCGAYGLRSLVVTGYGPGGAACAVYGGLQGARAAGELLRGED